MNKFKMYVKKSKVQGFLYFIHKIGLFSSIIYILNRWFGLNYFNSMIDRFIEKNLLTKYYFLINQKNNSENHKPIEKIIWICWFQGQNHMPQIINICINRVKKLYPDYEIIIITNSNINTYLHVPDNILTKVNKGQIMLAHFSDYIRCSLLYKYGGIWLDSTIFLDRRIPEIYMKGSFFTIKNDYDETYISANRWCTSILASSKNFILFKILSEVLEVYLNTEKYMIDYFLFDYIIDIVYNHNMDVKKIIDAIPCTNKNKDKLSEVLPLEYNESVLNKWLTDTFLFKLTWKIDTNSFREYSYYVRYVLASNR